MIWRESLADLIAAATSDQMNMMFDAGSTINLFSGTMPASIDDADAGTLIWQFTLNDPVFNAAEESPRRVEMDVTGMSGSNVGTGTIAYYRLKTNAGTVQAQGTCGASGADINWAPSAVVAGSRVLTLLQFNVLLDLIDFEV
jgi:hypothetical protein